MRSNLLSLQQTAKLQDLTQNRLATGLKVNSAIDNPSSYYTAQSLNNRAEDLNILLDAMSQGIQTLKAVNESIEAGTKFLEQAKSVASSALETARPVIAKVSTEAELLAAVNSGKKGLIVLTSDITMSTNQNIVLNDGQSLVGARYFDKNAAQTKLTLNFDGIAENGIMITGNSILSNLDIDFSSNKKGIGLSAISILNEAHAELENINFSMNYSDSAEIYTSGIMGGNIKVKGFLNITDKGPVQSSYDAAATNRMNVGINNANIDMDTGAVINILTHGQHSHAFLSNTINMNTGNQLNIKTLGHQGQAVYDSVLNQKGSSIVNIKTEGSTTHGILNATLNMESASLLNIDTVSDNSIASSYAWSRGKTVLNLASGAHILTKSGTYTAPTNISNVILPNINPGSFAGNDLSAFGLDKDDTSPVDVSAVFDDFDTYIQNSSQKAEAQAKGENSSSAEQFNQILTQYDMLINDSWYKGVNLLKSQDLKVVFNESRTSDLDIKGVDATTKGLGLETADWSSADRVQNSLDQIDSAINQLRLYASEFGNYYQIVTTRENFTNSLINVLTEGADALTLADMNQESANMLALQTRQQLAVNSLSLASQASQSVLKLF